MVSPRLLVMPLVVVAVGTAWLLDTMGLLPSFSMVWIGAWIGAGIVLIVTNGLTRTSVMWGPFLIAIGVCSYLRQREVISWEQEMPILVILLGLLWGLSRFDRFQDKP